MKTLFSSLLFILFCTGTFAQNISGKWVGKITQSPGGYSQLYDFELDLSQKKNIWGDSYAYIDDSLYIRIGLSGYVDKDSIRLSESKEWVRQEVLPPDWFLCVKNINLSYRKENDVEYLEGTWNGVSKEDDRDRCIPGRVILSRTLASVDKFLDQNRDSVIIADAGAIAPEPAPFDFSSDFNNTAPVKVTEIVVHNPNLQLQINDYLKVDDDTISIFLNRKYLAKNIRITKRANIINFKLDERMELHELLLFAENLGKIPPNTSQLLVVDGQDTHRISIESDRQKTAAVYLKYKPKK